MEWLTLEQAVDQKFQVYGSPEPQCLELPADLGALPVEIPLPGHFVEMGICPAPSHQWYGRIGGRPIIVEREKETVDGRERVFIYTSYLPTQDEHGDWIVLQELSELPASIFLIRPSFIQSRTLKPHFVVNRPDPAGWNSVVYNASSRSEAENLLEFLKRDAFNQECFVAAPEPVGLWSAIRTEDGRETILCTYSNRSGAISLGCSLSKRPGSGVLVVKDRSNKSPEQYLISGGRVVASSGD